MPRNFRLLSFSAFLLLPASALADDELELVDASFDDTYEDFTTDRNDTESRSNRSGQGEAGLLSSFDEDPEWDMPDSDDANIDEDPEWDAEPEIGSVFDDPFEEDDDFVIPQTAPEPIVEEESIDDLSDLPEAEVENIQNSTPGLDLSIFDIED